MSENYLELYEILGIDETKDINILKKTYKKLALKYHPDKNVGNETDTEKEFIKITNAYNKISEYLLEEKKENLEEDNKNQTEINISAATEFFKIFMSKDNIEENKNLVEILDLNLEDIYQGANKRLKYYRYVHCNKCQGQGKVLLKEKINCNICKGLGINTIIKQEGNILNEINVPCGTCKGYGIISKQGSICDICHGEKRIKKKELININIDIGFDKTTILYENMGNFVNNKYNNLEVKINLKEHPVFKKKNNDLIIKHKISLCNALIDDYIIITHLDKREIYAKFDGNLILNRIKLIRNEGIPIYNLPGKRGNLIIKLAIKYPKEIDPLKKDFLKKILPYKDIKITNDMERKKLLDKNIEF